MNNLKLSILWILLMVILNPIVLLLKYFAVFGTVLMERYVWGLNFYIDQLPKSLIWIFLSYNLGILVALFWPLLIKYRPDTEMTLRNIAIAILSINAFIYISLTLFSLTDINRWPMIWGFSMDYDLIWPPKYYLVVFILVSLQMLIPRAVIPILRPGAFLNAPNKLSKSTPKNGAI